MTIREVRVNKLFGIFTHVISFKKGGISLIIGENGVGKTISLTMIESFFNKKFDFFLEIDFQSLEIVFDDDRWIVTKDKILSKSRKGGDVPALRITNFKKETFKIPLVVLRRLSRFRQIDNDIWIDRLEGSTYNVDGLAAKFGLTPNEIGHVDEPVWYNNKLSENKIRIIAAQRLYQIEKNDNVVVAIKRDSDELAKLIQKEISKALEISAGLDSSFPNRLMTEMKKRRVHPFNDLLKALADIENMRNRLNEVGLTGTDNKLLEWEIQSEEMSKVLWLYIEDSKEKLNAYKDILEKLTLMRNIINRRFKFKQLYIDKEKGYVFKSSPDSPNNIPIEKLSSGEQNEMVLIYHLLFKCNESDVIMIDEPEISLHITWQHHMIDDLSEISKINNLSLLLATHSPDLIGDNWNLVQTLS